MEKKGLGVKLGAKKKAQRAKLYKMRKGYRSPEPSLKSQCSGGSERGFPEQLANQNRSSVRDPASMNKTEHD